MVKPDDFWPASQTPFVIQPQERIQQLKKYLEDPSCETQKSNLLALIEMYGTKRLPPLASSAPKFYVCEGKVMENPPSDENPPPAGCAIWAEGISTQMHGTELSAATGELHPAKLALQMAIQNVPPRGRLEAVDLCQAYVQTGTIGDSLRAIMVAPWRKEGWNEFSQTLSDIA
ncbi:uncharacterized protein TRUGW13939_10135 [Talaromyces rugulosus]|uniref:Uncharacterized protein n=1 Tax=Talaromyces rugulosus TaxID=121627 RepID=A0A7H8RA12_TALRU|nr:uncharacterized protein TRUGW13939_10135 [Talaromyces rugulosus]QKX62967.1 hypothetical protein TRUGW13939_10135 [Talaromyces rugulosus]